MSYDQTSPGVRLYKEPEHTVLVGVLPHVTDVSAEVDAAGVLLSGTLHGEPYEQYVSAERPIDPESSIVVIEGNHIRIILTHP